MDDVREVLAKLVEADDAVSRLQRALDLPFKPIGLMPINEAKLAVGALPEENRQLRAEVAELKGERDGDAVHLP